MHLNSVTKFLTGLKRDQKGNPASIHPLPTYTGKDGWAGGCSPPQADSGMGQFNTLGTIKQDGLLKEGHSRP